MQNKFLYRTLCFGFIALMSSAVMAQEVDGSLKPETQGDAKVISLSELYVRNNLLFLLSRVLYERSSLMYLPT